MASRQATTQITTITASLFIVKLFPHCFVTLQSAEEQQNQKKIKIFCNFFSLFCFLGQSLNIRINSGKYSKNVRLQCRALI